MRLAGIVGRGDDSSGSKLLGLATDGGKAGQELRTVNQDCKLTRKLTRKLTHTPLLFTDKDPNHPEVR